MRHLSALLLVLTATCSSPEEHAPFKPGCVENCKPPPPVSGSRPPPAEAGAGGGPSRDGGVGTLTTNIWVLGDSSFNTRTPFSGAGTLSVRGPTFAVSSEFAGTPTTVNGVEASPLLWVAVTPAGTPDVLPTLQPVDGRAVSVDVDIARATIMNDVMLGAIQTSPPPTLDPKRAQLVITFVNRLGLPLTDIEIAEHNGDAVLYDAGGSAYSDTTTRTGPRGMGIVINARPRPASSGSDFPGGTLVLTYRGLTVTTFGSFEVYAAPGSVSLVSVKIEP
jgi:hypothetical protein